MVKLDSVSQLREEQTAVLVRAEYPYGKSQTWLPMDLHKVAAQLDAVGIRADVVDLNFESLPSNLGRYDFIGIGVIGAPYIPTTRRIAQQVKEMTGKRPLIGGPCIGYLSPEEFRVLYGDATQIKNTQDLSVAVGREIPSVYDTSVNGRIRGMEPSKRERYLRSEMSFFVSQGCKFACDFCAAERSRPGSPIKEQFSRVISDDLDALCESAVSSNVPTLAFYLTSLDLFQNPAPFKGVLETFTQAKQKYGVDFRLRGLSRADSFLQSLREEPDLYSIIPSAGLRIIGFGVDGTSERVWRSQHKGIKSLSDADTSFEISRSLDVTPEALMVMGFHDSHGKPVDTSESLRTNFDYAVSCAEKKGVVARPHVAKDMVPGNNGWNNPVWAEQRARLFANPTLFRNLDFVALASEVTHPDAVFREQVNAAYTDIIRTLTPQGLCATSPLLPYSGDPEKDRVAETVNMLIPFDR